MCIETMSREYKERGRRKEKWEGGGGERWEGGGRREVGGRRRGAVGGRNVEEKCEHHSTSLLSRYIFPMGVTPAVEQATTQYTYIHACMGGDTCYIGPNIVLPHRLCVFHYYVSNGTLTAGTWLPHCTRT